MNVDTSQSLLEQVDEAYQKNSALNIQGGNSKAFYGHSISENILNVTDNLGIISYEPTELVITARAGTPIKDIIKTLDESQQILAFEPPLYNDSATLGGTIACNFSGPRRAYTGAARDYVLGCTIINGKAEKLKFGGQVMKNVAGYDASRLMCGAMGTLGVLLECSLKVVPKPEAELSLVHFCNTHQALDNMHKWTKQSYPISGSCYDGKQLSIRLSGNQSSITAAQKNIGGEVMEDDKKFWHELKEQKHNFFNTDKTIWRLSLASNTPVLNLKDETLYEWGGALRWYKSSDSAETIRNELIGVGGHATLFKNNMNNIPPFQTLESGLLTIHKNLKYAFDPKGILNPGIMYSDI